MCSPHQQTPSLAPVLPNITSSQQRDSELAKVDTQLKNTSMPGANRLLLNQQRAQLLAIKVDASADVLTPFGKTPTNSVSPAAAGFELADSLTPLLTKRSVSPLRIPTITPVTTQ